jgi:hypothetical protein
MPEPLWLYLMAVLYFTTLLLDSGGVCSRVVRAAQAARTTLLLRLLKNKGFKEERMTKVESCAIGTSTTLESNKSLLH